MIWVTRAPIRQQPVAEAAELEAILAIFAGYVLDVQTIRTILRWEMPIVQESPIMQELKNIWAEEAREEGREAILSILRGIITFRFNVAEDHFDYLLTRLDLAALVQLKKVLFDAKSLAALEQALQQLAQAQQDERSAGKS